MKKSCEHSSLAFGLYSSILVCTIKYHEGCKLYKYLFKCDDITTRGMVFPTSLFLLCFFEIAVKLIWILKVFTENNAFYVAQLLGKVVKVLTLLMSET